MVAIGGDVDEGYGPVADEFRRNFDERKELGAACAVVRDGRGSSPRAYGHSGSGGSLGYADPDRNVGYAYAMNRAGYALPTDPREVALRSAIDRALG